MRRIYILISLLMLALLWAPAVSADPDYDEVGLFVLPWACGEGHVVTWDPEGHWAANKASGWAYDFSMLVGTPLYAPVDGEASFLIDERPLETNLGNYIDLVSPDGDWLIRLAHLRDPQTGRRHVRAGELIGHSGMSGVPVAHLHFEVFVRSDGQWVVPDADRLTRFFGLPITAFFEGAMLTNDTCVSTLMVEGDVVSLESGAPLGTPQRLAVKLRNDSVGQMDLNWVQIALYSPQGLAQAVELEGGWQVAPRESLTIQVPAELEAAGDWYVGRVIVRSDGQTSGQPAGGQVAVASSPIEVLSVVPGQAVYGVGDDLTASVWLRNAGTAAWQAEGLVLQGEQPDGASWQAALDEPLHLAPDEVMGVTVRASCVPQEVGVWQTTSLSYQSGEQQYILTDVSAHFAVAGLQLTLTELETVVSGNQLVVYAQVRNVGSVALAPDRLEAWGWQPDGESSFVARSDLGVLLPGQTAWVRFTASTTQPEGDWQIVDIGYWLDGHYLTVGVPHYVER